MAGLYGEQPSLNTQTIEVNTRKQSIMHFGAAFTDAAYTFHPVKLSSQNSGKIYSKLQPGNKKIFNDAVEHIQSWNINNNKKFQQKFSEMNPIGSSFRYYTDFEKLEDRTELNQYDVPKLSNLTYSADNIWEDQYKTSGQMLFNMNTYQYTYKRPIALFDTEFTQDPKEKNTKNTENKRGYLQMATSPALFNPKFMVQAKGLAENVPLMNVNNDTYLKGFEDVSNCTIKELVRCSEDPSSTILGRGRYRYVDFMYCKDLGKMPNNHLLTLRKFALPIGDNITNKKSMRDEGPGDIGRLVTWFGTEDNKLENILKFEYKATWKPLNAQIEEVESKEEDEERGPLGKLLNSLNPQYNSAVNQGYAGSHSMFSYFGINTKVPESYKQMQRLYDKNVVYEPKNTIQDTHIYEGKLQFTNSFSIKFAYKLRAYDNINPKSAFLDLIGNILEVTYRRGRFWGGDRRMIGAPRNGSGWNKAQQLIGKTQGSFSSFWDELTSGGSILDSFKNFLGSLGGTLGKLSKSIITSVTDGVNKPTDVTSAVQAGAQVATNINKKTGISSAIKGVIQNKLGRPARYALQSYLSGDDVGLWHLTVGNPKNPIVTMGNLILENAVLEQSGPLGLDDFPTELSVTVTLKHARSRDVTEISKLYTKGLTSIYKPMHNKGVNNWYPISGLNRNDEPAATLNTDQQITNINLNNSYTFKPKKLDVEMPVDGIIGNKNKKNKLNLLSDQFNINNSSMFGNNLTFGNNLMFGNNLTGNYIDSILYSKGNSKNNEVHDPKLFVLGDNDPQYAIHNVNAIS